MGDATAEGDEDEEHYPIDRIIDHGKKQGRDKYLVQWRGYDEEKNTWEDCKKIEEDAPEVVQAYLRMLGEDPIHKHKTMAKRASRED